MTRRSGIASVLILAIALAACGGTPPAQPAVASAPPMLASEGAPATAIAPVSSDLAAEVDKYLSGMPSTLYGVGSVDQLKALQDATHPLIVDVREPVEYAQGHIPGAVNIPVRTLAKSLDKIPAERTVVLYCRSGLRGGIAAAALGVLGYTNVVNFEPAFLGWSAAQQPISTEASPPTVQASSRHPSAQSLASVGAFLASLPAGYYGVSSVQDVLDLQRGGAVVVDVRSSGDFASSHIAGAVNMPLASLGDAAAAKVGKDEPVIVQCATNSCGGMAVTALQLLGYGKSRVLTMTPQAWKEAGGKLDMDECAE